MDVSIIIVNYNTKDILYNCLTSIYKHTQNLNFEIIVSDNGSTDGSIEMIKHNFPQVILIENNANLGFGAANNRGLEIASGKYIFYLNSDTILLNNAVKIFYDYWENFSEKETLGALGCNLLNQKLAYSTSYATFPDCDRTIKDLIKANYGLLKVLIFSIIGKKIEIDKSPQQIDQPYFGSVDFVIGADLFLKNDSQAFFDEKIFLYNEEIDLQYRLMKFNKKRIIIDGPRIIHLEKQSSVIQEKKVITELVSFSSKCKNISRIYFFKKNISVYKAYIIKYLTLLLWLNPLIIKYTYKDIPTLLKQ